MPLPTRPSRLVARIQVNAIKVNAMLPTRLLKITGYIEKLLACGARVVNLQAKLLKLLKGL